MQLRNGNRWKFHEMLHENLAYSNWLFSRCSVKINCFHIKTREVHIHSHTHTEFSNYYIHMPQTSSCYTLFWRKTKRVCLVGFCSTSTTVTCDNQVKFMLFVNMRIMSSSVSRVWVGIVGDIILSPRMPPDGLNAQEYCFLETLPSELPGFSRHLSLSLWGKCEFNTTMF
jgi:hypothetical protein